MLSQGKYLEISHPALPAERAENNSEETQLEEIKRRGSVRTGEVEFIEGSQSLGNLSNNYLTGERYVSKVGKFYINRRKTNNYIGDVGLHFYNRY